jgi:hypothetical protein
LEVGITGHNFGRGPSKDHSTKVWLQLAQWFLRRRLKCEMLTDRRRTKSDDNSSHGLKARWAKNWMVQSQNIMCQSRATCLPAEYCFSELTLKKSSQFVSLVQFIKFHHEVTCSCYDIAENLLIQLTVLNVKQQYLTWY